MLKYSCFFNDKNLYSYLKSFFLGYLPTASSELSLVSPTFCHGLSGFITILMYVQRIFDINLKDIVNKYVDLLLKQYNPNIKYGFREYDFVFRGSLYRKKKCFIDFGLLNGVSGVYLTLISYNNKNLLDWATPFLGLL